MKLTANDIFTPLTAQPFSKDGSYTEVLPDKKLRPYIRCYWKQELFTSNSSKEFQNKVIIPDACMDIIMQFNEYNNFERGCFVTVDEIPHISHNIISTKKKTIFGIRFYAWTAGIFAAENINGISGTSLPLETIFPLELKKLVPLLLQAVTFEEKIYTSNQYFLEKLSISPINYDLMNLATNMINTRGIIKTKEIIKTIQKSERQVERLFKDKIGVSPKTLMSLIRYQNVWKELLQNPQIDIQDLVFKYGYYDQSHFIADFKKRHGMGIKDAINYSHVGFFL